MDAAFLDTVRSEVKTTLAELLDETRSRPGDFVVVGCSTSEVIGEKIGTVGNMEAAEAIYDAANEVVSARGLFLAAQCCEHLNRALVVEQGAAEWHRLDEVNAVPQMHAGGSFATAAYQKMEEPVLVPEIQAIAGIDIGGDAHRDALKTGSRPGAGSASAGSGRPSCSLPAAAPLISAANGAHYNEKLEITASLRCKNGKEVRSMILALDAGNTNICAGCIEGGEVRLTARIATDRRKTEDEYAGVLEAVLRMNGVGPDSLDGSIICSVVPPVNRCTIAGGGDDHRADAAFCQTRPQNRAGPAGWTTPKGSAATGLPTPSPASALYSGTVIVVDMGTMTTLSVVNGKKEFLGGAICPGIRLSQQALAAGTSQLPAIGLDPPGNGPSAGTPSSA